MSTFLEIIAPNVTVQNDHEHVKALHIKHDLKGDLAGVDVQHYTPALISDHGKDTVENTTKLVLKAIRSLPVVEVVMPQKNAFNLGVVIMQNLSKLAEQTKFGPGNHVYVSLNTFELMKDEIFDLLSFKHALHVHPDEHIRDDEIIVSCHNEPAGVVEGGMFIAKLPDGEAMMCQLPFWDSFYRYIQITDEE
jgi:hypothetical protein